MPNWCSNNLLLYSNNEDTLENIRKAFCEDKLLDYLIPMPEGLKNQEIASLSEKEKEKLEQHNLALYGSIDWYYWTNKNWGTKWDVGADDPKAYENNDYGVADNIDMNKDEFKYSMKLSFDSAWGPPREAIEKLRDHDVWFILTYYEAGIGFCGILSSNDEDEWDTSEAPEWMQEEFGIEPEEDDDENDKESDN
jgi:hypothetical protein